MAAEGIEFRTNTNIGGDENSDFLLKDFNSILLAIGSTWPRDLPIPGRNLCYVAVLDKVTFLTCFPSTEIVQYMNVGGIDNGKRYDKELKCLVFQLMLWHGKLNDLQSIL